MLGKLLGISTGLAMVGLATCGPLGGPPAVISNAPIPNPAPVASHRQPVSYVRDKLDAKIEELKRQVDDIRAAVDREDAK